MAIVLASAQRNSPPKITFSDVNLRLYQELNTELVFDLDSIRLSITTIMATRIGSRVFRREFGSRLTDLLFDPMDDTTVSRMRTNLLGAIRKWEPRIAVSNIQVTPVYETQSYYIGFEFIVPALQNKPGTFSLSVKSFST